MLHANTQNSISSQSSLMPIHFLFASDFLNFQLDIRQHTARETSSAVCEG